jgi:RsiW-degrading membrane proteinase PrsW (M82 family)
VTSASVERQALQRSLFQPREPAFWVYLAFVTYGAFRMIGALVELTEISRSGWALSWVLVIVYALPLGVLIYRLDLYEREPISLAIGAFAWGALAATALALDAAGWDQLVARVFGQDVAARWGPALTAPIIEELLTGAGVVLICLIGRDEIDDVMDGFVYGALCGLGFAVVEDVLYFMAAFGGSPGGVLEGFYVRVVSSGLYGHVLYTGLTGMGIGYLVPTKKRLAVAVALFLAAVLGHALWNAPVLDLGPTPPFSLADRLLLPVDLAVKGLPLLLVVVIGVSLARDRERRWLDRSLVAEIGREGISAEEFEILRDPKLRRRALSEMRRRAGRRAATLLRRLQREQVNLAMIVSRAPTPEDPAIEREREYCRSLRDALAAIPGAATADAAGTFVERPARGG